MADLRPPGIDEQTFERADELISALRPADSRWGPDPAQWIFRGHADARWLLLPSAMRRKSLRRFVSSADDLTGDGDYCQPRVGDVWEVLKDFAQKLNAAGLPIPGGRSVLRCLDNLFASGLFNGSLEQLAALGQHHGLPTMLLDWTRVGTIAAYFAASEVADLPQPVPDGRLDVWALNKEAERFSATVGEYGAMVRLIEPLFAGNVNLHSQGGMFTVLAGPADERTAVSIIPCVSVDDAVRSITSVIREAPTPMMRRLSLPHREAPEVLRLLAYERVAGTALFPGLDGVVRSVRDDRHKR